MLMATTPAPTGPVLTGASAIGKALGICERHVRRLAAEGRLPGVFRLGRNNSPLRITRDDLRAIRAGETKPPE